MDKQLPPRLAYTLPEFLAAAGISRGTFYKLPPSARPKFRTIGAKQLIPVDEAARFFDSLPAATWDQRRGIHRKRAP